MAKKMTKAALLERRSQIVERRNTLVRKAEETDEEGKERGLTEEEVEELESLKQEKALIEARIEELEELARLQAEEDEDKTREVPEDEEGIDDPTQRKYHRIKVGNERRLANPITQLLRSAMTGNVSKEVKALSDAGAKAHRSANLGVSSNGIYIPIQTRATLQATVAQQGKEGVATDLLNILDPIRENLVVAKAGATILTGLVGNIDIPSYSGTTAAWEGENTKAKDGAGEFATKKLSPKRLATTINISRQLLLQDSIGIEAMLLRDIVAAVQGKVESTMFSAGAGGEGAPAGLLNGKVAATAVVDYATLIDLATKLRKNLYAGAAIKAIANPLGYATLAKTPIMANVAQGFLVDGDKLSTGQDIFTTTAMSDGIMMGDFAQLILGQWGSLEVKVDDTSRFDEGLVRIMINSYWDYGFRDDKAYEWAKVGAATSGDDNDGIGSGEYV